MRDHSVNEGTLSDTVKPTTILSTHGHLQQTGGGHLHRRSVLMFQCKRPPWTLRSEKELSLKCSILDKLRSIICSMMSLLHHLSQAIQNNYLLQFQLHSPTHVIHKGGRLWRRQGHLPVLSIKEEDCGDVKGIIPLTGM